MLCVFGLTPVSAAAPALSGTGAPYLRRMLDAIAAMPTAHVTVSLSIKVRQATNTTSSSDLDVAWAPGNRFRLSLTGAGPGGGTLVVGTGSAVFFYNANSHRCTQMPAADAPSVQQALRARVAMLPPGSPAAWNYAGRRSIDGRSCDYIVSSGGPGTGFLYLDHSSHLPHLADITRITPRGSMETVAHFRRILPSAPASLFRFSPPAGSKPEIAGPR